uniref:Uncharacterized protein n=1 Tax=Molossus molossus TaxID=27622 RepID=A0A7J8GR99_MOLMO|nr:hypothetical protein HJG59_011246 [Molossus molossus]
MLPLGWSRQCLGRRQDVVSRVQPWPWGRRSHDLTEHRRRRLLHAGGRVRVGAVGGPTQGLLPASLPTSTSLRLAPLQGGVGPPPAGNPPCSRLGEVPQRPAQGAISSTGPEDQWKEQGVGVSGLGRGSGLGSAGSGGTSLSLGRVVTVSGRHPGLQGRDPATGGHCTVSTGPARLPQEAGPRA